MLNLDSVPLHAFHDAAARGGRALVRWLPAVHADNLVSAARRILDDEGARDYTTAFVTGGQGHYHAEFFSPTGHRIHFCGHGSLIAGWYVLAHLEEAADTLMFQSGYRCWEVQRSNSADLKLVYARPEPVSVDMPEFAADCLGATPQAAAQVGTDEDYLILELGSAVAVQELQPDARMIAAATRRALIVTAVADAADTDFVFRYFAPQYGDAEDTATGSAAVQLAAYWAPRLGAAWLTARQLSAGGAVMQLRCNGQVVELASRVGYG